MIFKSNQKFYYWYILLYIEINEYKNIYINAKKIVYFFQQLKNPSKTILLKSIYKGNDKLIYILE